MTMNLKSQRKALLKAARWVANHPTTWNKKQFFGTETGRTTGTGGEVRGFDAMGATYPFRDRVYSNPSVSDGNAEVAAWVNRSFPDKVIGEVTALNDKSASAKEAVNRIRSYVGANFPRS